MARRSSSNTRYRRFNNRSRVANANARYAADRFRPLPRLDPVADRRRWHPDRAKPALMSLKLGRARLSVRSPRIRTTWLGKPYFRPVVNAAWDSRTFADPVRVMICVRRKVRRAVLHALGRKGRGGKGRRNFYSDVRC